jgi:hypothetical protein
MDPARDARLIWGEAESSPVASANELDDLLDDLTEQAWIQGLFTVQLVMNNGTALLIVVGGQMSHVEFYWRTGKPLAVGSRGPWDDDELIALTHCGQYSELPRRFWVPTEDAREAMRQYFRTGSRPTNITWGDSKPTELSSGHST